MTEEKKPNTAVAIAMVIVALFFDLVQIGATFIPYIGWILSPVFSFTGWAILYTWWALSGMKLRSPSQKMMMYGVFPLVEIIPLINALPGLTTQTIIRISYEWTKKKVPIKKVVPLKK